MSVKQRLTNVVQRKNRNKPTPKISFTEPRELSSRERHVESDEATQPFDRVDLASMDSFPCSDPPGYYAVGS